MNRLLAFVLLICFAGLACRQGEETTPPPEEVTIAEAFKPLTVGQPVPVYAAVTPGGDTLHIGPGQPLTLLNLWATWCGPCIEEFPDLEHLHQTLAPRGLRIVAVDVDPDPPEIVTRFAADLGVTFPLAIDPDGRVQDRFQAMAMPSSYLIDRDGHLLARWTGILPPSARDSIEAHLVP